jgi:HKD family nuclease
MRQIDRGHLEVGTDRSICIFATIPLSCKGICGCGFGKGKGGGASMRFLSEGINEKIMEKLKNAIEARIAVAFFKPDDQMLHTLRGIAKLKLIVSEEFTFNNPHQLEKLETAELRSISPYDPRGKLHATVFIVKMGNGSCWTLVGSANLTSGGMSSNQEACMIMESANPEDAESIQQVEGWFDSLSARPINLEQAKSIYDNRPKHRPEPRITDRRYWALKTTSDAGRKDHWDMFWRERVIAIGWESLPVNPSSVSRERLRTSIKDTYHRPKRSWEKAAVSIEKFKDGMKLGDIVLLCRGYTSAQRKPVHIYAIATVDGPFRAYPKRQAEWRFKRNAVIQPVDKCLPRDVVAEALGKKTLLETIHELDKDGFDRIANELKVPTYK